MSALKAHRYAQLPARDRPGGCSQLKRRDVRLRINIPEDIRNDTI